MSNNVKDVSIVQGEQAHVLSVMAKAGKTFSKVIADLIAKSSEVDAGPVTVLSALRSIFNTIDNDGVETDHILDEFPRLNTSSIKGDDDYIETNGYTERYEAPVTKDGETKNKKMNFFTEAWAATDEGKAQAFVIAQCLLWKKDRPKTEPLYKAMTNVEIDNLLKKTKNEMTKGRAYLRKAVGMWATIYDLKLIEDKKGEWVVTLEETKNDTTANSYPYNLINWAKGGQLFRPMKVSDVLRLDVAAAQAEGGDLYDALEAQLSRDTGNGTKSKTYPICTNSIMVFNAAAAIVNGLDDSDALATELKEAMSKKKGGREYVEMLGTLRNTINSLWSKSLQVAFDRYLEDKIAHNSDMVTIEPKDDELAA